MTQENGRKRSVYAIECMTTYPNMTKKYPPNGGYFIY